MQKRQLDRRLYFNELAKTSEKYFIPYLRQFTKIDKETRIIEVGCGDGGNLLPFAKLGCTVVGCDIFEPRIIDARRFFEEEHAEGQFIASDAFLLKDMENQFDLLICHDVIEHISDKYGFMNKCQNLLKPGGIMFMSFPAWQMPFGGHQQICKSKLLSHLPFFHLLPASLYKSILKMAGEDEGCIRELLSIKETRCPIELFKKVIRENNYKIVDHVAWFINPHYEIKFGLKPRKLYSFIDNIPYVRNFFTTSSFFILSL